MNSTILQSDLYLNPDPLIRLIGEPNEAIVKIEGQKFDSLIDSGAQISQLTESLVKALDLKIQNLKEILPLEGAAGIKVPYLGYVEAQLEIPGVDAFNEDCLFLVMPDHEYGHRVPVTIGTLHMSHFAYTCKTEGQNGISRLISGLCVNCLISIPEYSRLNHLDVHLV